MEIDGGDGKVAWLMPSRGQEPSGWSALEKAHQAGLLLWACQTVPRPTHKAPNFHAMRSH